MTTQHQNHDASDALNTVSDRFAVRQEVPIDPRTGKPYLNTVAAIQVSVTGAGSEVSPYVTQAIEVIRDSGLPQETNALFTDVEGDLDDVLHVAGEAAKKLAGQGYRTSLVLHMDIRPGFTGQLAEKPKLADAIIAERRAGRGETDGADGGDETAQRSVG
ncbi:thiamine-binding protein [Bifidobacterium sp. MA2]|uniref:Thiamine-binding protein n=1 Tax=Bifidobacterium santillanense TaxID=2809028 RepID=A0ABS5UN47_9BIFI|nr:thiamine-binding protein [Bifidobacterium santillanense]